MMTMGAVQLTPMANAIKTVAMSVASQKKCIVVLFVLTCTMVVLLSSFATLPFDVLDPLRQWKQSANLSQSPIRANRSQSPIRGADDVIEEDNEAAVSLTRRVRVLVWVMTSPKTRDRAKVVKTTWGRRVPPDVLLFCSSVYDPTLPTVALNVSEGRVHLTAKTMRAFDYIYQHYFHKADFFMKADDDTYVIMENLRFFLSHLDPNKPFFTGRHFKPHVKQGFLSGGAGYVLSRAALARLANRTRHPPQCGEDGLHEDVQIARCLETLRVPILNSTDVRGGSRFHPYPPIKHVVTGLGKGFQYWEANKVRTGPNSVNEYPISFHYVSQNNMKLIHFFLYRIRPYGVNHKYE